MAHRARLSQTSGNTYNYQATTVSHFLVFLSTVEVHITVTGIKIPTCTLAWRSGAGGSWTILETILKLWYTSIPDLQQKLSWFRNTHTASIPPCVWKFHLKQQQRLAVFRYDCVFVLPRLPAVVGRRFLASSMSSFSASSSGCKKGKVKVM